ncbi:MAG: hypothetical protein IPM16_20260 [Chloroflexi bacterium]|nr:hypothetical protein [Chloroflexota bacterium]
MSDEKKKNFETEFSFNFSGLADKISEVVGNVGEEPETSYFDEKIGEATVAKVEISGGMGKLHVHPVEDETLLAQVETKHVGKMNYVVSQSGNGAGKNVKIENQVMKGGFRGIIGGMGKKDLYVDAALTTKIPLELKVETGVGEALVDVRDLSLISAFVEGGVGPATVYLPEGDYKAKVEAGVGPLTVNVPAHLKSTLRVEGGVGPCTVNVPAGADLTLDVEAGVGPMVIRLAAGTPFMVDYEGGLGPFHRPEGLVQKSKKVWQTEGYDLASESVFVKLEGGVGPCKILFVEDEGAAEKAKPKNDE